MEILFSSLAEKLLPMYTFLQTATQEFAFISTLPNQKQ